MLRLRAARAVSGLLVFLSRMGFLRSVFHPLMPMRVEQETVHRISCDAYNRDRERNAPCALLLTGDDAGEDLRDLVGLVRARLDAPDPARPQRLRDGILDGVAGLLLADVAEEHRDGADGADR